MIRLNGVKMIWSEWLATQNDRDDVSMSELHRRHDKHLKGCYK